MINMPVPLFDVLMDTGTASSMWQYAVPAIISLLTALSVALVTKLLNRTKTNAETRKLDAETRKTETETSSLDAGEWKRLYDEIKIQYSDLKKEIDRTSSDMKLSSSENKTEILKNNAEMTEWKRLYDEVKSQYAILKKEADKLKIDIKLISEALDIQKEETAEIKEQLRNETSARKRLEGVIKKFQQWAVRNIDQIEAAKIEPVPIEAVYFK
jgi:chromosome segregation ATPase